MIIKVHQANHCLVFDIGLALVAKTLLFLTLLEVVLIQLHVEAADDVLEDGLLD